MRQARRQGAQGGQRLALTQHRLGVAQPRSDRVQDAQGGGRTGLDQSVERGLIDLEHATRAERPDGGGAGRAVQQGHFADDLARSAHGDHQIARTGALGDLELAFDDDVQRTARAALLHQHLAGRQARLARGRFQQRQIGVGQFGEQRQLTEQLVAHSVLRYWRMTATAAAPSPVAEETR